MILAMNGNVPPEAEETCTDVDVDTPVGHVAIEMEPQAPTKNITVDSERSLGALS
jgi:hypothetical protein